MAARKWIVAAMLRPVIDVWGGSRASTRRRAPRRGGPRSGRPSSRGRAGGSSSRDALPRAHHVRRVQAEDELAQRGADEVGDRAERAADVGLAPAEDAAAGRA